MSATQPYTVVLVGYNSQFWIDKHLPFYLACEHLIIVDNASSDGTCDFVRSALPRAQLIRNPSNRGFGAACNQGLAAANTPYVVLLNPDCVCTHDALDLLLAAARTEPSAAIVAPQVFTKSNVPEVSYRMGLLAWPAKNKIPAQGLLCVEFVTGACFLMNKALVDQVHGFDEAYFMYYEDEDLCLRLRTAGFSILVEPASTVQHFARTGSQQGGWGLLKGEFLRGRVHTESKVRFYRQYKGVGAASLLKSRLIFGAFLSLPIRAIQAVWQAHYLARTLGRCSVLFNRQP
jgi:N-acetylglucosaminyl-diphospho-decaprenol L-rhamnosyltransferase